MPITFRRSSRATWFGHRHLCGDGGLGRVLGGVCVYSTRGLPQAQYDEHKYALCASWRSCSRIGYPSSTRATGCSCGSASRFCAASEKLVSERSVSGKKPSQDAEPWYDLRTELAYALREALRQELFGHRVEYVQDAATLINAVAHLVAYHATGLPGRSEPPHRSPRWNGHPARRPASSDEQQEIPRSSHTAIARRLGRACIARRHRYHHDPASPPSTRPPAGRSPRRCKTRWQTSQRANTTWETGRRTCRSRRR